MASSFEATRATKIVTVQKDVMPSLISHLHWDRSRIEAEQTRKLRQVLSVAKSSSRFYAKRLADVDPETFRLQDLHKIEPVTKQDVMENWDDIVTDPNLTLAKANKHLAALRDGKKDNYYLAGNKYVSATGGSSGHRGVFVWDDDLFETTSAITYRFEALDDSNRPSRDGPKRTAVICAGTYLHGSRMVFPQSPDPEREVKVFPASLPLNQLVANLNAFNPDRLVGYSSIVGELCNEASAGRLNVSLNKISVNSEPLETETRQQALDTWGINIHNTWGSVEIGVAGVEGKEYDGIILAEDCLIFEGVAESGEIVEAGEADHMLVTRLFGLALPLIRYKVTDSPKIEWKPSANNAPAYRRITELRGRSDIFFRYQDGKVRVHPMTFRSVLGQYAEISEYQVRQTPNGADIDLVVNEPTCSLLPMVLDQIKNKIKNRLIELGLDSSTVAVTVTAVDGLRRHPETQKLTRFVPFVNPRSEGTHVPAQ